MKKVLLIEDRSVRQKFFIEETKINLNNYSDLLDNYTNELYDELELQIENNNFNFEKYDYIISHKSAFGKKNNELLGKLKDYCKVHQKTLILFSGGISANYYDTSEFEILELNSKTFYSKNLELFLEAIRNNEEEILMLCYGEKWRKNIISNNIEKLNIFIDSNEDEDIEYSGFISKIDIRKLENIYDNLYAVKTEDGWMDLSEILKLRDSLYKYFDLLNNFSLNEKVNEKKSLLIHNNNISVNLQQFSNTIKFTPNVSDIDEYISKDVILEMQDREFDVLFIKDNLSSNYLELYGLRVIYHIRLSEELEDKKYVPIVILSDFSSDMLNRLDPMARILLTKNIFLIENTKEAIEKTRTIDFSNLTSDEYQNKFLNKIEVEQPKDYLTHHSIANEWSMYRWAEYLDVNTPDIEKIRDDISSMLYFKYLQAKFPIKRSLFGKHKQEIQGKGKILYIDDEWEKGWKSIFEHLSQENAGYSLETVQKVYKDKSQEEVITFAMEKVVGVNPDVIILDMRLHENDFLENVGLADFTGIQIFSKIKEINPGIQVIIFTASSNSLLLDQLNSYDSSILGYVKKEHPKNYNLTTQGNINKLISLINKGLERKYLKDIFTISNKVSNILSSDPFSKYYKLNLDAYEEHLNILEKKAQYVFDILDSTLENRFNYAMISITTSLEAIVNIFLIQRNNDDSLYFWDKKDTYLRKNATLESKIKKIINDRLGYTDNLNLSQLILNRNGYIHSNSKYKNVSSSQMLEWFQTLLDIIEVIDTPSNYHPFDFEREEEARKNRPIKDLRKKI